MRFSYNFSQLLGTVYRKGNIIFSKNGDSVIAPVGNKISVYDLKNNKSETLSVESRYNYTAIALSPNGVILIAINEDGEADVISLLSKTVIHKFRFNRPILAVKFSPNGKFFALTKENSVFVYRSPGSKREYNPFTLERVFHGFFDETTCLDWSSDSRFLMAGSKDMSVRVYALDKILHFKKFLLGGNTDAIVGCFFERDSMDAYTVAKNGTVSTWEFSEDIENLIKIEGIYNQINHLNNFQ
jgi:periodic tryptophan protein 2